MDDRIKQQQEEINLNIYKRIQHLEERHYQLSIKVNTDQKELKEITNNYMNAIGRFLDVSASLQAQLNTANLVIDDYKETFRRRMRALSIALDHLTSAHGRTGEDSKAIHDAYSIVEDLIAEFDDFDEEE